MKQFSFVAKEQITKGWSNNIKYCVTDDKNQKYLLRISPMERYEERINEFKKMKQVSQLGVPMCQPIEAGRCEQGVYQLQSWIDGKEAEQVIPFVSETQQYVYGLDAGRILKKIHSIVAPSSQEDWEPRFQRKIEKKIKMYQECPIHYENGDALIEYIEANRYLLAGRPQSYQHGDYHIGNMMIDKNGTLTIIDFDRDDYGDPWEEFNRIVWCAQKSPLFASGMVNGYFNNQVPMEFWKLLALYIANNTLSSLPWAIPYGEQEVQTMITQAKEVLDWYDNMKNPVPTWYFQGYYIQWIDGIPYKLKSAYDFSFLSRYGKVFKIYDDQDSGNICFGVEKDGERYFIKFAGAPTEQYEGKPEDAIMRLKETVPIYQNLHHSSLIEFVKAEEAGTGFLMMFRWTEGECMGRMYPESRREFMELKIESRLEVFLDVLHFMESVAEQKYVAIDFYDGSILYDFKHQKTIICDIDYFRKMPCKNDMGRMWGSSRFQSPEEYELGATLDEITNVYTLGATAFALFSDYKRTREGWPFNQESFEVITKAVSENRGNRQQSIRQLIEEWKDAIRIG